jgi:hypothetical protein
VGGAVKPAFVGANIGDIADPYLIGNSDVKLLTKKIAYDRQGMLRIGGGFELPYLFAPYAKFCSETPYSAYTGCYAMGCKIML